MPSTPVSPHTPQLTLSLFDSTALSGGFTLDGCMGGGGLLYREPEDDGDDMPPAAPAAARVPPRSWRLTGDRALAHGWKARAADNVAAIRLAQAIAGEDRHATADEQEALSRFTGFGASELAQSLFRRPGEAFRPGWEDLGTELKQLVTPEQMSGLARATQYAHFTPEHIVRAIWGAVTRMGFAAGTVLEPGCGTGLFLALMPEALVGKTAFTAVEMDPCTAQIATLLHPDAWVRNEDFTKARIAETFELVIGNPPFSDRTVRAGDPAGRLGLSLHDYFIARSIERLKPGGLAAFVTSRFTMDKSDQTARAHIAGMADLVGAVRLPAGSMQAASGTEVVVDVLLFQKRPPGIPANGTVARLGVRRPVGYFRVCSLAEGGCVAWMLRLVKIGVEGEGPCTDIMEIHRPDDLVDIANLGLTLAEAKLLLAGVQREIVAVQAKDHAVRRPNCACCGDVCRVKDYRDHAVSTLFGQVTLRLPRFCCAACGGIEAGIA